MALAPDPKNSGQPNVPLRLIPEAISGNLPAEVNLFIGRESELARLRALLAEGRLLTLVGPGGVGKTRLALRLEADVRDGFRDGAWMVDLSPITDTALLAQAVGDILGVREPQGDDWVAAIIRALRPRRALLLLDNCEHLIEACAALAEGLVRSCPELHVLATSLQPLGADGETIYRVPPLAVPAASASDIQELGASDAVRLFVARVRAQLPDFALGERNAAVVAEICRRLDGLPLALELVAARVEGLGLAELAERLDDRFALAVGGRRTAPPRQQTLQAALGWTCSLLDPQERVLLRRLSVFVGGWTLEAAEKVCAGELLPADVIIDTLGRLVTRSLVIAERDELKVRYRLLETVRAYGFEQLEASGETATLQARHARYMLELAEREPPETLNAAHAARLRVEEDNVRAALTWAVDHEQFELGLGLATAAYVLWWFSGHFAEGSAWLERLLTLWVTPSAVRGKALVFTAQMRQLLSDYPAAEVYAQSALDAHHALGDAKGAGLALMVLGNVASQRGDLERAATFYADATPRLRELGPGRELVSLFQTGVLAAEFGDVAHVRDVVSDLEKLGEARPQPVVVAAPLHLRSRIAAGQGDVANAVRLLEEALAVHRSTSDEVQVAVTLIKLGNLRLDQGQTRTAIEAFAEAMQYARDSGDRLRIIRALEGCARVLAAMDADAAVRMAGATTRHREAIGAALWPSEQRYLDSWLSEVRRKLTPVAYQRAWEDGRGCTLSQAVNLAEPLMLALSDVVAGPGILSRRELEIASLLALGLANKEIAAELVVSAGTVRTHVEHILSKLNLHSRAQIGVWATQQGLSRARALSVQPDVLVGE